VNPRRDSKGHETIRFVPFAVPAQIMMLKRGRLINIGLWAHADGLIARCCSRLF